MSNDDDVCQRPRDSAGGRVRLLDAAQVAAYGLVAALFVYVMVTYAVAGK